MGDSNASSAGAGPGTCMWDDTTCKMNDWGSRLTDVEYISIPFVQWGNLVVLLWTLLLAFSTKFVFGLPFVLLDKQTKSERQMARKAAREKRDARKRRMKKLRANVAIVGGGGLVALAKAVSAGALKGAADGGDGEAKQGGDDNDTGEDDSKTLELQKLTPATSTTSNDAAASVSSNNISISVDANELDQSEFIVWRSFDHQIVFSDNKAMCIAYAAFVTSVMMACSGTRIPLDYDDDPLKSLIDFLLYSTLAYLLLILACVYQSKLLMIKLDVRKELLKRNVSVAITFAGISLASAINLRGSMMGSPSSQSFIQTLGITIMYFVFGQISVLIFGWVFQAITKYDDQKEAMNNNPASGIKWSSNLIALAVISSAPIERTSEIASFWAFTGIGSVFLVIYDWLVSNWIVPGEVNHEISNDKNWGYALICSAILLTTSMSFEAILKDLPCPGSDAWDKYIASFVVPGDIETAVNKTQ